MAYMASNEAQGRGSVYGQDDNKTSGQDRGKKEMKKISFIIPIEPVPQMRARHAKIKTKTGIEFDVSYKHPNQKKNEADIQYYLDKFRPVVRWEEAIIINIRAFISIPKSKPSWWKEAAQNGIIRPETKPDIDNLEKFIYDVLKTNQYFKDDSQIIANWNEMFYSETPRWEITITEFPQPKTQKEYKEYLDNISKGLELAL